MPMIQVTMRADRMVEQKRKIAQRITGVMVEEAGAPRNRVDIAFYEVSRESYARSGVLMSDKK